MELTAHFAHSSVFWWTSISFICLRQGFRAFTTAKDGSKCLAMEYGGEQSLNDLIEKRREDGLKAFPAANIEKVALHVVRGLQVHHMYGPQYDSVNI